LACSLAQHDQVPGRATGGLGEAAEEAMRVRV
jgi:hypothetical protein